MDTCYPLELGLTKDEIEQIEKEIAEEDERRLAHYSGDTDEYEQWKKSLETKHERTYESRQVLDDTSGSFITPANGARCLVWAVFENAIADFLRYNPENAAMIKSKEKYQHKKTEDNPYHTAVKIYEDAEYFIFQDSESTASGILNKGMAEQFRANALKRLNDLKSIGWKGYANRIKGVTQKNYHNKEEV